MKTVSHSKEHLKTLAALFDRDHGRLLGLLDDVQHLGRKGSYLPAAKVFGEFRLLQDHHLASEEEALEELRAAGRCPDDVRRRIYAEHAQIKQLIEATWRAITGGDHSSFEGSMASLARAVSAHERGEREELLPRLCAYFSDTQLDDVVHGLVDR